MTSARNADVSSRRASDVNGARESQPYGSHREPHDCAGCTAALAELIRFEATADDETTEPDTALVLSQVVARIRGAIEGATINPVPGQRWRSTSLPGVEATVDLVDASEVHLSRFLRGERVGREYVHRHRFSELMWRRGWTLRDAPGLAVEDHSDDIPPTLRAVGRGVFEGEFGEGGERRIGSAAVVVSDHDDGLPETDQGSRDDVAQQLGATGETLAVITGSEET